MNPFEVPPLAWNALPLAGLLIGLLCGWALNASHHRRARRRASPEGAKGALHHELTRDETLDQIHAGEVELAQLENRLSSLNKAVATTRQQLQDADKEYKDLLLDFDERQSSVKETQGHVNSIRQSLEARNDERNRLLSDVDRSIEEMDLLNQLKDSYAVKINRLTQQVQWQDAELRMLRGTMKARTTEMEQAKGLLDQRETELRLLIRQRQQREIDIDHARQLLSQKDDEFRRQMGAARPVGPPAARPAPALPHNRIDVTPRALPAAAPHTPVRSYVDDDVEDDLTVIPRLATYYAEQLKARGVKTVEQLAALTPDQVRAMLDIPGHHHPNIENWIKVARRLARQRRKDEDAPTP